MAVRVADLPQFTVESVAEEDEAHRVTGRFSHVRGVRYGRGWLYVSAFDSVAADLEVLDSINGHAVMTVLGLAHSISVGDRFPWFDAYWRPHQVAMVVEPDHVWAHTEFVAAPARFFLLAGVRGWQGADAALPDGAVELEILQRVVLTRNMPQGNKTGMTEEERERIRCWIEASSQQQTK